MDVQKSSQESVSGSVVQAVYCPNPGGIIHIDNKVHGSPSRCAAQWLYQGPKKRETEFSLAEGGSVTSNVDDRTGKKPDSLGSK